MKLWRYGQPVEYLGRRYRLDGMLGSGGMADVCLACDEREQREVALKILKSDDLDQETLNRFMKEAAQIAHWQHPHILRVYESLQVELIDAANGSVLFYMVSEYARGGDLQKRLTPGRPFPLSASFALFRQLCDAVQYAHERGVIHRDLKPLNMLFRRPESGPEEVVLSDFGLAVQVDASHHTFAHGGTLAYMAPEQFQGNALPASDIFALGVILYLLCTGGLPFRRTLQDMPRIVQGPIPVPTRPSLVNPELPPMLDDVLLRAVRELPAERYQQPREFWEAIEFALMVSARTFPFGADAGQNAGQTWPYDGSEQPQRSRQAGPKGQLPDASDSRPGEETPEVEEGSVSALWIAREKQKASPVRLPLPTTSIPMSPNLAEHDASLQPPSERAASATWQPVDDYPLARSDGTPQVEEQWRDASTERAAAQARAEQFAREARARGNSPIVPAPVPGEPAPRARRVSADAGNPSRPAASLSGSTILPGPHSSERDEEQTSRKRQPFAPADDPEYQTSRRQPSHPLPGSGERRSSRRQPFEPPGAFPDDPLYQTSRGRASRLAPDAPARQGSRRQPGDDQEPQSSRRNISTRADHAGLASSTYDASAPFEDEADSISRPRATPASTRRQPASASNRPNTSAPRARGTAGAFAPSTRRVPGSRLLTGNQTGARRRVPLVAILCVALVLGLLLAIFAAATFQGALLTFFGAPVTRVALQPRAQLVQESAALNVRVDGGQLASNEIPGRQLSATSPTQSTTANATGAAPGKRATGQLTFINNGNVAITLQSTVVTGNSGIPISFNGPITIPALNPSFIIVTGFAVQPGANGNIPQFDVVKNCCAANIVVKNSTAFTGGQDGQPNSVIQQKDIDGAAKLLAESRQTQAQAMLQHQVQANESVVGDAQCQAQTSANQKAGALAKQVTVQVAVTCSENVYNANAASQFFARDLQRVARANPALGAASALDGQVTLALLSSTPAPPGGPLSASLQFHAQGLWVYQFRPDVLRNFANLIAGKSQDAARALLLQQPGVSGVQFSGNSALPVNTSEIQINVQMPATS